VNFAPDAGGRSARSGADYLSAGDGKTGEVLRREPVVWAAAERHLAYEAEPLPLALFSARFARFGNGPWPA
jgi:hypothetical protein